MLWSPIYFIKDENLKGKSLPQIIFNDPDWFFAGIENRIFDNRGGTISEEANDIYYKARHIKIPDNEDGKKLVRYVIGRPYNSFQEINIIPREHAGYSEGVCQEFIDMYYPRQIKKWDKSGYKLLISNLKYYLFKDKKMRMTKEKCEEFFNNENNFVPRPNQIF